MLGAGENRVRRNIALAALAVSAVCFPLSFYRPAFYVGALMTVVAALLLTPFLSLSLARILRYPLHWLRPVEGALAADSLIQAPRRTSATVAALMLSLALAIAHGGVSLGSVKSITEWMNGTLNPDLFVNASQIVAAHDFRFPASMEAEFAQIPEIAEVQPVRTTRVKFRGQPIMIVAGDAARTNKRIRRIVVSGDPATMNRLSDEGKGVIIAENMANLHKLKVGDYFEVAAPAGQLRLPIVGVARDYSNQLGSLFVDRKVYIKYFNDDTIDFFRVFLKPGASAGDARRGIQERLGRNRRLFVLMNEEVRKYVLDAVNQWLGMTYLQVFVALIVGILGIVNTLTVSISDRRARARRAARGGRLARTDPRHGVAGIDGDRRDRAGARHRHGRVVSVLRARGDRAGHCGHAAQLRISIRHYGDAVAGDSGGVGGVGDSARRDRGPQFAGGGFGI